MLTLDKYYPAGGQVADEIKLTDLKTTQREDVLFAKAKLPYSSTEKPVVIYRQLLANGEIEYRAISAKCPHQGADISQDELKPDGNVYCSLHHRPICIFSEYNRAYLTVKRGDDFYIIKN